MQLKKQPEQKIFRIRTEKIANPLLRVGVGLTRGLIEHTLCFPELNKIYDDVASPDADPSLSFARRTLQAIGVTCEVNGSAGPLAAAGRPVVFVANHPYGGIEGVLMLAMIEDIRPDIRVMANYLLAGMPQARDHFIFVDPFGHRKSAAANIRPLKECLRWLKQGHSLGAFPAGEVSSVDLHTGQVRDPAWSPSIAAIVRRTRAAVVPVYFSGQNGALFNMAGLVHPRLRTLMLPKQLVNKRGRIFSAQIGQAIPWEELEEYATDESLIQYLRLRTYILAERQTPVGKGRTGMRAALPAIRPVLRRREMQTIIEPVAADALAAEVEALPPDSLLLESGDMRVYQARAPQIPAVLREIGRLREITFRAVGEGTGRPCDLDRFDNYYIHLFIWNQARREMVGAYRMGLSDQIMEQHGVKGFYTHTCFRFNRRLIGRLDPAIELGRSFVRPEYQKAFSSLLLLWRGICTFVVRNPHYRNIFGPVSITNEYRDASRNLMLRSLRLTNFEHELARLVRPRKRPRRPRRAEWNLPDFHPYIDNLDLATKLIQEIESDQKGIPVLLRQYLKMGGRVLAFNVDPAFSFAVDALISCDLPKCDPRVLRRYMGAAGLDSYLRCHGIDPAAHQEQMRHVGAAGEDKA